MSGILPASVDYTDKDFDALRSRMAKLLRSVFPGWTDFDTANFGNLLVELFCFVGDVLGFYQDGQARESKMVVASQRKNIIALARAFGYELPGAYAATADVTFALADVPEADVVFPAGTVVRTQDVSSPVRFQRLDALTIPAGTDPPQATGTVEHSETHTQSAPASGLPNQEIFLTRTPYLDGSAVVSAGNGVFTEVDSLLDSGPNDRHFQVLVDQNDRARLRFGNGANGALAQGTIGIVYRTGGGPDGNVEAEAIEVIDGQFFDAHGRAVTVSVSNAAKASGGIARQTVAAAREQAPRSLRVLNRTVAREDYEINAQRVAGVARALMLTSDQDTGIPENQGILFVVPEGGGAATQTLLDAVETMCTDTYPNTTTFRLSTQVAAYKTINIVTRIYVAQGQTPTTVANRVRAALAAMFQITNDDGTQNDAIDFGYNQRDEDGDPDGRVIWSDVFNTIRDTSGVRRLPGGDDGLTLNGEADDVLLAIRDFPTLGTVLIYNAETGGLI